MSGLERIVPGVILQQQPANLLQKLTGEVFYNATPHPHASSRAVLEKKKNDLGKAITTEYHAIFDEIAKKSGIHDPTRFKQLMQRDYTLCVSMVALVSFCTLFRLSLLNGVSSSLPGYLSIHDMRQKERTDIFYEQTILSITILSLIFLSKMIRNNEFLNPATYKKYREVRQATLTAAVARVLMYRFTNFKEPSVVPTKQFFFPLFLKILQSCTKENDLFTCNILLNKEISNHLNKIELVLTQEIEKLKKQH
ncbi:MAG: hypothetical protein KDK65_01655 [Chlamydiia bacterium]|nr:hypothetical protein [Chlamydiia bacterium]